jgi:DNA-binding beta-propeller fold protein YncE
MGIRCRRLLLFAPLAFQLAALSLAALSPIEPGSVGAHLPPAFLATWGSDGAAEGQFNAPNGVTVDEAGNIYVVDTGNDRVQKFDSDGNFLLMWGWGVRTGESTFQICPSSCQAGILGSGDGQFNKPSGVAVDGSGYVYVTDTNNHRIEKFSSAGTYVGKWGTNGTGWTGFYFPSGVAVDVSGDVYVVDSGNYRIKKHSASGAFLYTWGWGVLDGTMEFQLCGTLTPCQAGIGGSGDGQFNAPAHMAIDISGNIYVADKHNHRIQKFNGVTFVGKWGTLGSAAGELKYPSGVAVDARGNVYVAERENDRISKFDSDGNFLVSWGTTGSGTGEFSDPRAVATDAAGLIYVVELDNHRVQEFGGPWLNTFVGETDENERR